jgi:hypothetical protein
VCRVNVKIARATSANEGKPPRVDKWVRFTPHQCGERERFV